MPFRTRRSSTRGTPRGLFHSNGSINRYSKSVKSYWSIQKLLVPGSLNHIPTEKGVTYWVHRLAHPSSNCPPHKSPLTPSNSQLNPVAFPNSVPLIRRHEILFPNQQLSIIRHNCKTILHTFSTPYNACLHSTTLLHQLFKLPLKPNYHLCCRIPLRITSHLKLYLCFYVHKEALTTGAYGTLVKEELVTFPRPDEPERPTFRYCGNDTLTGASIQVFAGLPLITLINQLYCSTAYALSGSSNSAWLSRCHVSTYHLARPRNPFLNRMSLVSSLQA